MEAYTAFADAGALKMHVVAAMLYDPTLPLEPQIELFKNLRQSADRNHVSATAIKILVTVSLLRILQQCWNLMLIGWMKVLREHP